MAQQQTARLQAHYRDTIVPGLMAKFGYKSTMEVPRLQQRLNLQQPYHLQLLPRLQLQRLRLQQQDL
jgi:hypothetical protein